MKKFFALIPGGLVVLSMLGMLGCRSDILKEPPFARPETGLAARVQILDGSDCRGMASVVKAPEHCAWPESARQSFVMSAVVEVVAHVGADGRADGARLVHGPSGYDFDAAAVECALQSEYRAQVDENGAPIAGETCPVSLRLARYAQDVVSQDQPSFFCPPTRTHRPPSGNLSTPCDL